MRVYQLVRTLPRRLPLLRLSRRFSSWGIFLLAILLCLLLAACGSSTRDEVAEAPLAAPTATAVPPTAIPASTSTVIPATRDAATAEPTTTALAVTESAITESVATESTTESATNAPAAQTSAASTTFGLDPAQSEARFVVNEVLFGNPNTVTGRTNEVSGEIRIDLANPPQSTVGEIRINARSLATDNRFRNRSINRLILQSNRDEYQYITFTPTAIEGLPAVAQAGSTFAFRVTGDLKIRDIVQPTTFDVTVTADSDTQISGLAQAVVQRADFGLEIPNVEGVADVTEDVHLELQFVATVSE